MIRDDNGVEAARFGAVTSGQTVLYDEDGALLFTGGITGARGHSGDNAGRASVVALFESRTGRTSWTSVFGCGLFSTNLDQDDGALFLSGRPASRRRRRRHEPTSSSRSLSARATRGLTGSLPA